MLSPPSESPIFDKVIPSNVTFISPFIRTEFSSALDEEYFLLLISSSSVLKTNPVPDPYNCPLWYVDTTTTESYTFETDSPNPVSVTVTSLLIVVIFSPDIKGWKISSHTLQMLLEKMLQ